VISKWQAFKYCLLSGICEPLGALVFGIFFSQFMNDYVVKSLLAGGKRWTFLKR
jgi:ZIP family zinc transporter